jgi:hypothetical protein
MITRRKTLTTCAAAAEIRVRNRVQACVTIQLPQLANLDNRRSRLPGVSGKRQLKRRIW